MEADGEATVAVSAAPSRKLALQSLAASEVTVDRAGLQDPKEAAEDGMQEHEAPPGTEEEAMVTVGLPDPREVQATAVERSGDRIISAIRLSLTMRRLRERKRPISMEECRGITL